MTCFHSFLLSMLVYTDNPSVFFPQGLQVAFRLGLYKGTKSVIGARDLQLGRCISRQLNEQSGIGTPFMKLSCRMQKAGTVSDRSGQLKLLLERSSELLQTVLCFRLLSEISLDGNIIAGTGLAQKGSE